MLAKQTDYIVGIYLRLSKDDERAGESLSIENQRRILTNYVREQGWTIYDEYVDDGISGTSFERPGVQRLLDDAKNGRINLIICKDLSRFGRRNNRYAGKEASIVSTNDSGRKERKVRPDCYP